MVVSVVVAVTVVAVVAYGVRDSDGRRGRGCGGGCGWFISRGHGSVCRNGYDMY